MRKLTIVYLILFSMSCFAQSFSDGFNFFLPPYDTTSQEFLPKFPITEIGPTDFVSIDQNGDFSVNGKQIKFWANNITDASAFPAKDKAAEMAGRMRKLGFNLVRFHYFDKGWGSDPYIFTPGKSTRTLDPTNQDKMEYLINEFKQQGLYINMNLHVAREFVAADGVTHADSIYEFGKSVTLFDPHLIELQKEYARNLLTHVNPYTGLSLINDPVMAMLEITNENWFFLHWQNDLLKPYSQGGKLTDYHNDMLEEQWNDFLLDKYSTDAALNTAWGGTNPVDPSEILANKDFEEGTSPWSLGLYHSNSVATYTIDSNNPYSGTGCAKVEITSSSGVDYQLQLAARDRSVVAGRTYKVEFAAKSSNSEKMGFQVYKQSSPYTNYLNKEIQLTNQWQKFSFIFTAPETNNGEVQFTFMLGTNSGTFWFDEASFKECGTQGLYEGESLVSKSVHRMYRGEINEYTSERVRDLYEFFMKLQSDYYNEMYSYLKNDLGVKVPISGSNWYTGLPDMKLQNDLDYVDIHGYWDHPSDGKIYNSSMITYPKGSTISNAIGGHGVVGKPLTISEYNHPFPNRYQIEAGFFMAGYGSYNEVDAIMFFAASESTFWDADRMYSPFNTGRNNVLMSTMPSLGYAYRNGLISPANQEYVINFSEEDVYDSFINNGGFWMYPDDYPREKSAAYSIKTGTFDSQSSFDPSAIPAAVNPYTSDTGELIWDENGILKIVTDKFVGFVGQLNNYTNEQIGKVKILDADKFAGVTWLSLDDSKIEDSKKSLLTLGTRQQNTGMVWAGDNRSILDWGNEPTIIEPANVTLELAINADSIRVNRLDPEGKPDGIYNVYYPASPGKFNVILNQFSDKSLWYGIETEWVNDNIRFTSQIGGKCLKSGDAVELTWSGNTSGTFSLDYSTDGGSSWTNISSSIAGSSNSYNWVVPDLQANSCQIRLTASDNPGMPYYSSFFSISNKTKLTRIILDEEYEDWSEVPVLSGPKTSGLFNSFQAFNDEAFFFFRLNTNNDIILQKNNAVTLYMDTDNNPATGKSVNGIGAEIEFNCGERKGTAYYNGSQTAIGYPDLFMIVSPTISSRNFEVGIDRNSMIGGNKIFSANQIKIVVKDGNSSEVIPSATGAMTYTFGEYDFEDLPTYSIKKKSTDYLRVISHNVEFGGFFKAELKDKFERLYKAMNPDVIGFEEMHDNTTEQVVARMEEILPSPQGKSWNAAKVYDNIIATRYPIKAQYNCGPYANGAFVVDLRPDFDTDLLMIVAHPPCCENDPERQNEVDAIMQLINDAKTPGGTISVAENTPIVIVGDMNFVGLPNQLNTLLTGDISDEATFGSDFIPDWDGTDFEDSKPLVTNLPMTFTQGNGTYSGAFSKGRLDFCIYSGSVLNEKNCYVFYTHSMPADTLTKYGLQIGDTEGASDHFPVVADFEIVRPVEPEDILRLRKNDSNGEPLMKGQTATVSGIVTVAGEFGGPAYIQDDQAGVAIYGADYMSAITTGDSVTIVGSVVCYKGLTEVSHVAGSSIKVHKNTAVPAPLVTTISSINNQQWNGTELLEARLVRLDNIRIIGTGQFGANMNYPVTDGTDTLTFRIDNNTDLVGKDIPQKMISVVGVVGQFCFNAPYSTGYQLFPRSSNDIITEANLTLISPKGGDELKGGSLFGIVWEASLIEKVNICFSEDFGQTWEQITADFDASKKQFLWGVPNRDLRNCKIKIYDYPDSSVTAITATPFRIVKSFEDNMIVNGDFTGGMGNWSTFIHESANASVNVVERKLHADITNGGTATWNVQLIQHNINMEQGNKYQIMLDASASANRDLTVAVSQDGGSYTEYGKKLLKLSTNTQTFSFDFEMTNSTDANARFVIEMGASNNSVVLDNIVMLKKEIEKSIEITSIDSGDVLEMGKVHMLQWTCDGVQKVNISLSTNGGVSWETVKNDVNASTGSYIWAIPNTSPSKTCQIKIEDVDGGAIAISELFELKLAVGVDDLEEIPTEFSMSQNYPNPFNPVTTIKYGLPESAYVKVTLFDVLGRKVMVLVNGKQSAGYHDIQLNASRLNSGVYLYTIQAGEFTKTRKMILLK